MIKLIFQNKIIIEFYHRLANHSMIDILNLAQLQCASAIYIFRTDNTDPFTTLLLTVFIDNKLAFTYLT